MARQIEIKAVVAGSVCAVSASEGSAISKGAVLMVLESMKMEIPVEAPTDGTLLRIFVTEKAQVSKGQVLAIVSIG